MAFTALRPITILRSDPPFSAATLICPCKDAAATILSEEVKSLTVISPTPETRLNVLVPGELVIVIPPEPAVKLFVPPSTLTVSYPDPPFTVTPAAFWKDNV